MWTALVKQKAAPERYSPSIGLLLVQGRRPFGLNIQAHVKRHPEAHAAVDPPADFAPASRLPDRHQGQRLHRHQPGTLELVSLEHQPLRFFEEVVAVGRRVLGILASRRPGGEMAAQGEHRVDQDLVAVCGLVRGLALALEEVAQEQVLGQRGEVGVVPGEVHVEQVDDELHVLRDRGPRADGVLAARVEAVGAHGHGFVLRARVGLVEQQVRRAAQEPDRAVLQPQLAHAPAQLPLELRAIAQEVLFLVRVVAAADQVLGDDLLGHVLQALARADLPHQVRHLAVRVVQNGLHERLERRVARLEAVNVLLVDALPAVVRVGVVDTLRAINRGACCTAGRVAITLDAESQ